MKTQNRKTLKRMLGILCVLALMLSAGLAAADTLVLTGTVEAGETEQIYAPIGGTVESVAAEAGQQISAGDPLMTFRTTKVYAPEDGTVTGVFVREGDDAETVANQYGALMYIEGAYQYTVSASISKAYSAIETSFVHAGEKVYLQCRGAASRVGEGMVTAIDASSYTVLVTSGGFIPGDSVDIYRDEAFTTTERVGRGTIARVSPTAVTATGAVVNVAVKDGDTVKKGDLLIETLEGTFEGYRMTGMGVSFDQDGVVASVSAEAGASVTQNAVLAQVYPTSGMRVEAVIPADNRKDLKVGDEVTIELETDESKVYQGTVSFVSALPEEEAEEVSYRVFIDFTPDEEIAFGMNVIVTHGEDESAVRSEEEAQAETEAPADSADETEQTNSQRREPPADGERPSRERPSGSRPGSDDQSTEESVSEGETAENNGTTENN